MGCAERGQTDDAPPPSFAWRPAAAASLAAGLAVAAADLTAVIGAWSVPAGRAVAGLWNGLALAAGAAVAAADAAAADADAAATEAEATALAATTAAADAAAARADAAAARREAVAAADAGARDAAACARAETTLTTAIRTARAAVAAARWHYAAARVMARGGALAPGPRLPPLPAGGDLRSAVSALRAAATAAGAAQAGAALRGHRAYTSGVARGRLRNAAAGPDEGGGGGSCGFVAPGAALTPAAAWRTDPAAATDALAAFRPQHALSS